MIDTDPILQSALSRLEPLIDWERRERRSDFRSLDPITDLLALLNNPQNSFRKVHVTGTKGKGSVCALIELGLANAGFSAARFSSPHVERVTERVTFNGEEIDSRVFANALNRAFDAYESATRAGSPGNGAHWFDIITAAAFLAFAERAVDWAVVEVGLGGRLDSTNVISAEVAILTNVDLEHTNILGVTREAIAREKLGILARDAALITSIGLVDPIGHVVKLAADQAHCLLKIVPYDLNLTIKENNIAMAGAALDILGSRVTCSPVFLPLIGWVHRLEMDHAAQPFH